MTKCLGRHVEQNLSRSRELVRETVPLIGTADAYGELGVYGNSGTKAATDS